MSENDILKCDQSEHYLYGIVDAYCEVDDLSHLFVPTQESKIYAENKDKIFLCGRKGSGKSAIAIGLLRNAKFKYTILFPSPMFYIPIIDVLQDYNVNIQDIFSVIWEYIFSLGFVCSIWRKELKEGYNDSIISDYMEKMDIDPYPQKEDLRDDIISMVKLEKEIYSHLENIVVNCLDNLSKHDDQKVVGLKVKLYFRNILRDKEFQKLIEYCLAKVNDNAVIIIDTVKRFGINDHAYIGTLKAMLEAAKDLQFVWGPKGPMLKCFVHAEIYDEIIIDEPRKYLAQSVFLRWKYKDLLVVLAKRFAAIEKNTGWGKRVRVPDFDRTTIREEFWNKVMVPTIDNRLGMIEHSLAYVIRHTQKRPRQVIALFSEIVEEAKSGTVNDDMPKGNRGYIFTDRHIRNGIHGKNNMQSMLKDILTVFGGPRGLEVQEVETMFDGESYIHSRKRMGDIAKRLHPYLSMSLYSPNEMMGLLLRSGLIGRIVRPMHEWREADGQGMYLITVFEYQQQGVLNFNEISEFGIHPILSDSLGLKGIEGNKAVIYPYPEPDELPTLDVNDYHGRLD